MGASEPFLSYFLGGHFLEMFESDETVSFLFCLLSFLTLGFGGTTGFGGGRGFGFGGGIGPPAEKLGCGELLCLSESVLDILLR